MGSIYVRGDTVWIKGRQRGQPLTRDNKTPYVSDFDHARLTYTDLNSLIRVRSRRSDCIKAVFPLTITGRTMGSSLAITLFCGGRAWREGA